MRLIALIVAGLIAAGLVCLQLHPLYNSASDQASAETAGGYINVKTTFLADPTIVVTVKNGSDKFRLRGRVAYTDKFGAQHLGAYARIYRPQVDESEPGNPERNNLVFEPGAKGNYDRLRGPNDPDDWD